MGGMTPLIQSRPAGGGAAFSCSDLGACSIANLGTKDHDLLDGLLDDDHTIYGLLSGRSGGQLYKGGLAASQHLTLQSTAHATRGYVRAQDDLQLLSNKLRNSVGGVGVQLAASTPHVTLSNEVRVGTRLGVGVAPNVYTGFKCSPALSGAQNLAIANLTATATLTGGSRTIKGIVAQGTAMISSGATATQIAGLYFTALAAGAGNATALYAAWIRAGLWSYSGTAPTVWGLKVRSPMFGGSTWPSTAYGVDIENQGVYAGSTHNAIGLKIADQTVTTGNKYLIEAGPATPYLRLGGGGAPGAGLSHLWLNLAGVLKQVQEDAVNTAGAGFRRLRVVN